MTVTEGGGENGDKPFTGPTSNKGSGGCDSGFAGVAGLAVLVGLVVTRKH